MKKSFVLFILSCVSVVAMDIDPDKYPEGPAGFQVCYENCYDLCDIIYDDDLGPIEVWGYGTFDRCVNGVNPSCTMTICNGCGS